MLAAVTWILAASAALAAEGRQCELRLDPPAAVLGVVPARAQLRQELDEPPHFAMRFLGPRAGAAHDAEGDVPLAIHVVEPGAKRITVADERLSRAVVTQQRVVAPVDGALQAGPIGGPLNTLLANVGEAGFDAVDAGTATWVLLADRLGVRLGRIDKAGKGDALRRLALLTPARALAPRLVRLASGQMAAAWVEHEQHDKASLWLVWIDATGKPRGAPQRLDEDVTAAEYCNIAIVALGTAAELAWAPPLLATDLPATRGEVTLEVRAFHVAPGASATAWPRERVQAGTWNVAGSAGGVLPIGLQAVTVSGTVAFLWTEMLGNDKWRLRGLVPGAAATTLGDESLQLGAVFARTVGGSAWIYGAEDGALRRARLRCE